MIQTAAIQSSSPKVFNVNQIIFAFGILKLLIHFFNLQGYGPHADELYYIELGKNFNWGFLDISPFVTWVAGLSELLFGSSIAAFRILPCLFSAGTVILTGKMTQHLGGQKLAIVIACSAMICSPSFLATAYLLQPAVFDQFFWALLIYSVLLFQKTKSINYLYLGAVALGFGMLNKYSILILLAAIVFSILVFDFKSLKATFRHFVGPLTISLLILLPNLMWQWQHGFPVFHYTLMVGKSAFSIDVFDYLFQLFFFHGASVAIWTAGFLFLLFNTEKDKRNKLWPVSFLFVIIFLALLKGKLYYGLGIFPILFAAGGVCWAIMLQQLKVFSSIFFVGMLYFFALLSLPIVIPILNITSCREYVSNMVKLTGFSRPLRYEDGTSGNIPQFFADMSGWKLMVNKISDAAKDTNPKNAMGLSVITDNYAIAGALKYFGDFQMPPIISTQNSFLIGSPATLDMMTVIYLSKEPPAKIQGFAKEIQFIERLKTENSHLNGLYIYRFSIPSIKMKLKYIQDRQNFYPEYSDKSLPKTN